MQKIPYGPCKDFASIAETRASPNAILVGAKLSINSVRAQRPIPIEFN
jgi:hypothetical protein